ncbi:hypothetical protein FXO38_12441 [Capsicum annuum]|nr:hypothetical protein FXO37_23772 [Capsicum annuum]KAF3659775.1 hypothetical protein FXO38_12441 [Capsicum annuum]
MPKSSQPYFPHLVLHRSHSHLIPNNLISNPIFHDQAADPFINFKKSVKASKMSETTDEANQATIQMDDLQRRYANKIQQLQTLLDLARQVEISSHRDYMPITALNHDLKRISQGRAANRVQQMLEERHEQPGQAG